MADFKAEVLKQLEEGKINAQEALAMLGQQKPDSASGFTTPPPSLEKQEFKDSHRQGNWVDDLVGWVGDVVNDVVEGVQDLDIPGNISDLVGGTYGHHKKVETFASGVVSQGISGLTLVGKNARVMVRGYDGDVIRVECAFNARRADADVFFQEDGGVYQLVYDEKMMRHVSINCEVPRAMIQEVLVASKNDKVLVEGLSAGRVRIATKNAAVRAEGINCTELIVQNRNDGIKAQGISATNIHLETTNAAVLAEDINANIANIKTSNSRIKTINVNSANLHLHTTNSGIKLDKTFLDNELWEGERVVEAYTTNGGIAFAPPAGTKLKIHAVTSNSKIICHREDLNYSEFTKVFMQGESRDYGMGGKRLRVKLATSNSSIKIFD